MLAMELVLGLVLSMAEWWLLVVVQTLELNLEALL
jgi:hypothetical protein